MLFLTPAVSGAGRADATCIPGQDGVLPAAPTPRLHTVVRVARSAVGYPVRLPFAAGSLPEPSPPRRRRPASRSAATSLDAVAEASLRSTCRAWHEGLMRHPATACKQKLGAV